MALISCSEWQMKKAILLSIFLCIFIGCGTYIRENRRQTYINHHQSLSLEKKQAILNGKLLIGMTREEVLASWGRPRKSNISEGSWGVDEQWIYGRHRRNFSDVCYVYFRNGILTSIQY